MRDGARDELSRYLAFSKSSREEVWKIVVGSIGIKRIGMINAVNSRAKPVAGLAKDGLRMTS